MNHKHAHNSLLILAVVVSLLTVSLYVYMYVAVDTQTDKVVKARDVQATQAMDEKQVGELKTLFGHSEPGRKTLRDLFVRKGEEVTFIESLEALGDQTGADVNIVSINEDKNVSNPNIGTLKARVEASGSWSQISKVLVLIETMQKSIEVDSVRINSSGQVNERTKSASWTLSLNITANTIQ